MGKFVVARGLSEAGLPRGALQRSLGRAEKTTPLPRVIERHRFTALPAQYCQKKRCKYPYRKLSTAGNDLLESSNALRIDSSARCQVESPSLPAPFTRGVPHACGSSDCSVLVYLE
jgi:hypothetical protein